MFFDVGVEVEDGIKDDSQVEEFGDDVSEQPWTSNPRLDVILLISGKGEEGRSDCSGGQTEGERGETYLINASVN